MGGISLFMKGESSLIKKIPKRSFETCRFALLINMFFHQFVPEFQNDSILIGI
jgi:hypothetical protein